MSFRPLPGLTVAAIVALILLLGLGTWQLQRRAEKHALLDQIHARETLQAAPIEILLPVGDYAAYRKATARGAFDHAAEIYVRHARTDGGPTRPGYRVLTPFALSSGGAILVDRGWVDEAHRDPATRKDSQPAGDVDIAGVLQKPGQPAFFTPAPDVAHRIFYVRDTGLMARTLGLRLRSPLIFELESGPAGGPEPLASHVVIPDNHLSYAITWYSLAIVLIVVYLRYHQTLGRLRFRK